MYGVRFFGRTCCVNQPIRAVSADLNSQDLVGAPILPNPSPGPPPVPAHPLSFNFIGAAAALLALFANLGTLMVSAKSSFSIEVLTQAASNTLAAHLVSLAFLTVLIRKITQAYQKVSLVGRGCARSARASSAFGGSLGVSLSGNRRALFAFARRGLLAGNCRVGDNRCRARRIQCVTIVDYPCSRRVFLPPARTRAASPSPALALTHPSRLSRAAGGLERPARVPQGRHAEVWLTAWSLPGTSFLNAPARACGMPPAQVFSEGNARQGSATPESAGH
jgi:hypothetical protein